MQRVEKETGMGDGWVADLGPVDDGMYKLSRGSWAFRAIL